jgi:hypothetical protein
VGGYVWSHNYYEEYYLPIEAARANGTLPQNATEYIIGGIRVVIPRSHSGAALPAKAMRKHFPTKFVHAVPGLLVTLAHLALLFYSPVSAEELRANYTYDLGDEGDDFKPEDCAKAIVCCRGAIAVLAIVCCVLAVTIALIITGLLFSFVENTLGSNFHITVPTIAMLLQLGGLCTSLALGFIAKNLAYHEARNAYHGKDPHRVA